VSRIIPAVGLVMAGWGMLAVFVVHLDATAVSMGLAGMFVAMAVAYGVSSESGR